VIFANVRRVCARKSPVWMLLPDSSMLAVPEMSRIASPFRSMRNPRENELGLG
jgi:hypothetical protein